VLVVWAARTNRRWLLPVAVVIAMPVVWLTSLSVLVASVYLVGAPVLARLVGRGRALPDVELQGSRVEPAEVLPPVR
jgi:hypothetical protein